LQGILDNINRCHIDKEKEDINRDWDERPSQRKNIRKLLGFPKYIYLAETEILNFFGF